MNYSLMDKYSLNMLILISRDGRVLGKMGHSERQGENRFKNVYGEMDQKLFEAGVNYFRGGK